MPKIWSLDWWWNNGVILEVSEFWFWLSWLWNMVQYILWCWRQTNLLCMRWSWIWLFSCSSVSKVEINGESGEGHGLHCLSIVSANSNALESAIECFHGTWALGNPWFWDMWNVSKEKIHLNYSSMWNTRGNPGVVCIISVFGKFSHWWLKKSLENLKEPTKNYGFLGISFLILFLEWWL